MKMVFSGSPRQEKPKEFYLVFLRGTCRGEETEELWYTGFTRTECEGANGKIHNNVQRRQVKHRNIKQKQTKNVCPQLFGRQEKKLERRECWRMTGEINWVCWSWCFFTFAKVIGSLDGDPDETRSMNNQKNLKVEGNNERPKSCSILLAEVEKRGMLQI